MRLRPAGLAVLGELDASAIVDATLPVTPQLDVRVSDSWRSPARAASRAAPTPPTDRSPARLARHPVGAEGEARQRGARRVDRAPAHARRPRAGGALRRVRAGRAACAAADDRLRTKRVSRLVRLQEVARALFLPRRTRSRGARRRARVRRPGAPAARLPGGRGRHAGCIPARDPSAQLKSVSASPTIPATAAIVEQESRPTMRTIRRPPAARAGAGGRLALLVIRDLLGRAA